MQGCVSPCSDPAVHSRAWDDQPVVLGPPVDFPSLGHMGLPGMEVLLTRCRNRPSRREKVSQVTQHMSCIGNLLLWNLQHWLQCLGTLGMK